MNKAKIIAWCEKLMEWLFVGIIFLTPVYFAYFTENYNVFELNKLLVVRLGVSLILFLWLIKVSLGAKVFYYNQKLRWLTMSVAVVYVLFGAIFSVVPSTSFWSNYDRQQGVYSLLYYWLFFVLLLLNLKSINQIKKILTAILLSSGLVSLYGFAQHFGLDPQRWFETGGRSFSSLGQPNFLGHYLIMIMPLTFVSWWLFVNKLKFFWWPLLILLQVVCLIFTYSRSAWLGLLFSGLVWLGFLLLTSHKKRKIFISLAAIGFLILFVAWLSRQDFCRQLTYCDYGSQRFFSVFDSKGDTAKIRLFYWQAAYQELKQAPWPRWLVGFGKDSQSSIFAKHYRSEWALYERLNSFPDRAHNLIIDDILEFGLLGLLAFAWLAGYLMVNGFKYLRLNREVKNYKYYLVTALFTGILAYFFAGLFGFPLTTHYLYYYLFLALLAWLLFGDRQKALALNRLSVTFKWTMTVILILFVSIIFYFFTIRAFVADVYYMKAKKAEANNDCSNVLYYANKMLDASPGLLRPKEQYIFLNLNCLPALASKNDAATLMNNVLLVIDSYPAKEQGYQILMERSHAYSLFGQHFDSKYYQQAEETYLKLIKLNPDITVTYQDYARMKLWAGDYDGAIKIIEQGLSVMPKIKSLSQQALLDDQAYYFYDLLGKVYIHKKESEAALKYFILAQEADPQNKIIYQKISDLCWRLGKTKEAFAWLEKGKALDPADSAWDYNQALYYWQQGQSKEALNSAQLALKLQPQDEQIKQLIKDISTSAKTKTNP